MKRNFLRLWDFSSKEIGILLQRSLELKSGKDKNTCPLIGRSIGLIFEKASTRTRKSAIKSYRLWRIYSPEKKWDSGNTWNIDL